MNEDQEPKSEPFDLVATTAFEANGAEDGVSEARDSPVVASGAISPEIGAPTGSQIVTPGIVSPDIGAPDADTPQVVTFEARSLGITNNEFSDPEFTNLEKPNPKIISPETIGPETTRLGPMGSDTITPKGVDQETGLDEIDSEDGLGFWVGIGASAGGLEALCAVVRELPTDLPCAYIIAQHLAPNHRSMLPEIIGRETNLTVKHLEDGVKREFNTIYITPPRYDAILEQDVLRLVKPAGSIASPKPSVDRLFKSLADSVQSRAIGIVLSGTGSDGAQGLKAIMAAGGCTIVQDPSSARYASMPNAAITGAKVENIALPEDIGANLRFYLEQQTTRISGGEARPIKVRRTDSFEELIWLLLRRTQVDFKQYKFATFQRRVQHRMAAVGSASIEDYVELAKASEQEQDALFQDLLISVTAFFRDKEIFANLKFMLRERLVVAEGQALRIWVAGTATGEEAYSVAMLLAEEFDSLSEFNQASLQIFATDIDQRAIEIARQGVYSPQAIEKLPPSLAQKYFETEPSGLRIVKSLREKILFSVHNVINDPPFLNLDLICCRNLLIYFQSSLQQQVFDRFHYALKPDGLLFLGKSESVGASEARFSPVNGMKNFYRQRYSERRSVFNTNVDTARSIATSASRTKQAAERHDLIAANARFESLVLALGDCGLLVSGDLQIEKAFGNVTPYLSLQSGPVTPTVSAMVQEEFAKDIRINMPVVVNRGEVGIGLPHELENDTTRRHQVKVYPISNGPHADPVGLVVFSSWQIEVATETSETEEPAAKKRIKQLTEELEIVRTNLHQTVEELEISNIELQSLNEELQSSNEELQSTNEELETSNEELQSTNEELSTVNEELQVSGQELNVANQNLSSILENVGTPLLVVNRACDITHMSAAAEDFFDPETSKDGSLLGRFKMPEGYPNLGILLLRAMERGEKQVIQVDVDGHNALVAVVPHFTHSGELIGAIVLISDNTDALISARAELELLFDTLPDCIIVQNQEGAIVRANAAACRLFFNLDQMPRTAELQFRPDNLDNKTIEKLRIDQQDVSRTGNPILGKNYRFMTQTGEEQFHRVSIVRSREQEAHTYLIAQNITDSFKAAEALEISEERFQLAISAGGIGLWDWDLKQDQMYWSKRFCEIVGTGRKAKSHPFAEFDSLIHPDDRARVNLLIKQHLDNREAFEAEFRIARKDGVTAQVVARGQALLNTKGRAIRMIGVMDDVTERYADMRLMRETKEQLDVAARLGALGYWTYDVGDRVVNWSDQLCKIIGLEPDAGVLTPEQALDFIEPQNAAALKSALKNVIETGKSIELETRIKRTNGAGRLVHLTGLADKDKSGAVIGLHGILRDVTDDREREQQLQRAVDELARSNEELNRFSYVCSHDMKEPVRLIESLCAVLDNDTVASNPEERREVTARIISNSARLRSIIDGLLAYSRIDARVERKEIDLNAVLIDVKESLALAIEDKQAEIDYEDLPKVIGARVHFNQLFQNLIGNALKYTNETTPIVRITCRKEENRAVISVDDNGPGIPDESKDKVFQIFKRLHRPDQIEGSGLGLSICQRIVSQYNGYITCEDSDLGGVSFVFSLPLFEGDIDE